MGTGEGAQAFGWGLYFAGRKAIAEGYKKTLSASQKAVMVDGVRHTDGGKKDLAKRTPKERAVLRLSQSISDGMDISHAIRRAKNDVRQAEIGDLTAFQLEGGWGDVAKLREVVTILEGWQYAQIEAAPGRLYEVEIPDDKDLLDWDRQIADELLSNLVFEACRSCGDLVWGCGFNSVFEPDAGDDFGEVVKAA